MTALLGIIGGIVLLALGGEFVVRGALALARRTGVSPLLAGLVIVGFGTSAPEFTVSLDAALQARPDIALANVVGSNIANVLLILGICALLAPLATSRRALWRDGVGMLAASLALPVLLLGGGIGRGDGAVLVLALLGYLAWAYVAETYHGAASAAVHRDEAASVPALRGGRGRALVALIGGLALLVGGARLLVISAIALARALDVPEAVIGLTVVAVGTSLPEFAVSLLATLRGQADVAVGNILGSNLFNLLGILGVTALIHPLSAAPRILAVDQWVMIAAAVAVVAFLATRLGLARWEGALLLAGYAVYVSLGMT
ncbi:Inner membrane protein YrbG [wastewater metagenome]|uniref:Inner membrane protein YrbG n=4 Tax=root TaxID=1 RepID=A0A5B8RAC7_9ZZZZ|nr:calcium/sodium antiporter [Arhodomonas aquaeolei]MCS4504340.1 calcium/sodium antiporter [Arhodomonas aquaeolei]QEA05551.1 inner membrane protein YrbG [uncultured organism]